MTPRCFAYVRVSTERQAGEVFTSLADQRAAISRLAASLGITVDEWFTDAGASGATAERRKGFMDLFARCQTVRHQKREPGFILVLNESRFGRFGDVEEATHWRVALKKLGWMVRFCEGDVGEEGFARSVLRLAASAQASDYLKNLKANATRGSRGAAEQGYWVSSAPFGYRRAVVYPAGRERVLENGMPKAKDEKVRLTVHEAEAAIVREAFQRYGQHDATLASVYEWLAIVAPARKWSIAAVRWLLTNPAYLGDVVIGRRMPDEDDPGRQVVRRSGERWGMSNAHPAIVTHAQFDGVKAKLERNAAAPRRARSEYPLSGLLRCSDCGGPYVGAGSKHQVSIYRCKASVFGACGGGGVAKHLIETAVIDNVAALLSSPAMRRKIRAGAERALSAIAKPGKDRSLVDAEAKAKARQANLVNAIADGTLARHEAEGALASIRQELARIDSAKSHEKLAAARQSAVMAERESIISQVLEVPARLHSASAPEVRGLLALWCQSLTYNRSTRRVRMEIRTAVPMVPVLSSNRVAEACSNRAGCTSRWFRRARRACEARMSSTQMVLDRAARVNVLHSFMTGPLTVLALWQPHATLCVAPDPENDGNPSKTHETRHWYPRGQRPFNVAIHAAKKNDSDNRGYFSLPRFAAALKRSGFYPSDPAPFIKRKMQIPGDLKPMVFGAIIGVATVTEISSPQSPIISEAHRAGVVPLDMATITEDDRWFGHYIPTSEDPHPIRYAWKLENAIMLAKPIHHVGRQDALYPADSWTRDEINQQLHAMEAAL